LGASQKLMNTYNKDQVTHSLNTLSEIFENDASFDALPAASKETFAIALLKATNVKPKPEMHQVSNGSFCFDENGLIRGFVQ